MKPEPLYCPLCGRFVPYPAGTDVPGLPDWAPIALAMLSHAGKCPGIRRELAKEVVQVTVTQLCGKDAFCMKDEGHNGDCE